MEIIAEKEYQEFRKDGTIGGGSVGGQSGPSLQVEIER